MCFSGFTGPCPKSPRTLSASSTIDSISQTLFMGDLPAASQLNELVECTIKGDSLSFAAKAPSDLWQRTYYGFKPFSAPAMLWSVAENFTFTVRALWQPKHRFDQCGLLACVDDSCWMKASVELEDESTSRLGSVVTNTGYSDWATVDVESSRHTQWYRLSRRGPDFLLEGSADGADWHQMRMFHLSALGETTQATEEPHPPVSPGIPSLQVGVYVACPVAGKMLATFDNISIGPCQWKAHGK